MRDLQYLPDPARFRRVLASGRAAGLHEDRQDLPDREDGPVSQRRRRRSARSATTSRSAAYWHKAFPYKSSLTGVSGVELADGYEKASGKQWTQQLGASLSLLDAGMSALQASGAPKDKAAVAKAIVDTEDDDNRRSRRLHRRSGSQRRARADHRHAVGEGEGGLEIPARLRRHRERDRSQRADRGQAHSVQRLSARISRWR